MLNVCIICRVCKFIRYLEAKKTEEKTADTSLSEEQIRMLASEWGAADIKDILAMRGKWLLAPSEIGSLHWDICKFYKMLWLGEPLQREEACGNIALSSGEASLSV